MGFEESERGTMWLADNGIRRGLISRISRLSLEAVVLVGACGEVLRTKRGIRERGREWIVEDLVKRIE